MSVILNAKGTSVPSFTIGKNGVTLYQGTVDPSLFYTVKSGDYWFDSYNNSQWVWNATASAWNAPMLADLTFSNSTITSSGSDLVLKTNGANAHVTFSGDTGPGIITATASQNLYIDPTLGGGGNLVLIANQWPTTDGSANQILKTNGSGILSWYTPTAGTVTTTSVVSANGFAGTVATASSTPAITLSTTVTGVLKGNGTAISAATSGTDYSPGTSALTTGILKSTTATGSLSIAVAADFPTLNQNTTGTAAGLSSTLSISSGGTNAITANAAFNNLVPSQVTNTNKFLVTDGTNTSWASLVTTGTATIDFGAYPGTNETSVAVTGLSNILSTSCVILTIMADATSADHTASDHRYFTNYANLSYSTPVSGTGFTIYSTSTQQMQGKWTVQYSYIV